MPRVHYVKSARKDNPAVKKGQPYFWWKFRYGGKKYSVTRPRHSQLCQGKNSAFYAALEGIEDGCAQAKCAEDLEAVRDEGVQNLEQVRDEYQEGFDNLPENFQYGSAGEQIQEAIDAIEELINELECWEPEEFEEEEFDQDEPIREDYDDGEEGDSDWQFEFECWEQDQQDHEGQQEEERQVHFEEQVSALEELAQSHSFPY